MILYKCLVNGSISAPAREQVSQGLARINAEMFGTAPDAVRVEFTEVPPGLWFTGGKPSQASMVLGSVPPGTSQQTRVALMAAVCEMFSEATGAPYNDVMVVAADPRPPG
ncbi:MAG TPA: hypothetical protein PK359_05200 [Burkholderiaceae bacterium]|jgi:phenylpyruvate tautomerase PptA (4-oxalocrotonate tautomerase family)|nr:hypothetical protein [Burkholderiaceae bacterium]